MLSDISFIELVFYSELTSFQVSIIVDLGEWSL